MLRRFAERRPTRPANRRTIEAYQRRSDARYLVSFPRTGSHWLRMLCEQYADRPTLVRSFYKHQNTDYLFMHVHDVDLDFRGQDVLYLFRHPIPTVFSTMNYHKVSGENEVRKYATTYGEHLRKWLVEERFSERKTLVRYEDLPAAFDVVAGHLGLTIDPRRLADAVQKVSREHVRGRTQSYDPQVVQLGADYGQRRDEFAQRYSGLVMDSVLSASSSLSEFFPRS